MNLECSLQTGLKVWLATNRLQFSRCKTLEIFTIKKLTEPLKTSEGSKTENEREELAEREGKEGIKERKGVRRGGMGKGEMNEIHNQGKGILRDTQSSSWGRSKQMSQGFTL